MILTPLKFPAPFTAMNKKSLTLISMLALSTGQAFAADVINPEGIITPTNLYTVTTTGVYSSTCGTESVTSPLVGESDCKMDIYKPTALAPAAPADGLGRIAVIFIHGGGWREGSNAQFSNQSKYLASKGITSFSIDYLLAVNLDSVKNPVRALENAKTAIRYIRANASFYGINPSKIVVSGGSAGGHLAAALATVDYTGANIRPNALALFNPVVNLNQYSAWTWGAIDKDAINPQLRLASYPGRLPAGIIFNGTNDTIAPYSAAQIFQSTATTTPSLISYTGRTHDFFGPNNIDDGICATDTHDNGGVGCDYRDTLRRTLTFITGLGWF